MEDLLRSHMWNLMLLVPALSWGPAGCAKHATVEAPIDRLIQRQLPGLWKDESGAEHLIIRKRKTPTVASITIREPTATVAPASGAVISHVGATLGSSTVMTALDEPV